MAGGRSEILFLYVRFFNADGRLGSWGRAEILKKIMMLTKNIDLFISILQVYSIIFKENKKSPFRLSGGRGFELLLENYIL
jgi:hypothetical protein